MQKFLSHTNMLHISQDIYLYPPICIKATRRRIQNWMNSHYDKLLLWKCNTIIVRPCKSCNISKYLWVSGVYIYSFFATLQKYFGERLHEVLPIVGGRSNGRCGESSSNGSWYISAHHTRILFIRNNFMKDVSNSKLRIPAEFCIHTQTPFEL